MNDLNKSFVASIKVHNDRSNSDIVDELRFYDSSLPFFDSSLQQAYLNAYQIACTKANDLIRIDWLDKEVCILDVRVARIVPGIPVDMSLDRKNDDDFKSFYAHIPEENIEE